MNKIFLILVCILSYSAIARTTVFSDLSSTAAYAQVELRGEEAKNLYEYLVVIASRSGSAVSSDYAMGRHIVQAPGVKCKAFNPDHLEPEDRTLENLYRCSIEYSKTGAIST